MVRGSGDKKMAGAKKINEKKELVIDPSVAVKWFNPELLSAEALELRSLHVKDQVHFYAPELFLYEVINALRWNPEFNKNDVVDASKSLIEIMISYRKILPEEALEIAYKYNLTVYDASYIALARNLGSILITADDKLRKQVQGEKCIVALSDYFR